MLDKTCRVLSTPLVRHSRSGRTDWETRRWDISVRCSTLLSDGRDLEALEPVLTVPPANAPGGELGGSRESVGGVVEITSTKFLPGVSTSRAGCSFMFSSARPGSIHTGSILT